MQLEGIHHITAITGDAPQNVDFYTRVLGLRMAAKTVNQDDPSVYHLFYADELGRAGSDITFFEYPGAPRGRTGPGMVQTIVWRVGSAEAIDFWERRLDDEGIAAEREGDVLRFADPEGLGHELAVDPTGDEPLSAEHPEVPADFALRGFDAVRAYSFDADATGTLLESLLGATPAGERAYELRGERRGGRYVVDPAPDRRGLQGARPARPPGRRHRPPRRVRHHRRRAPRVVRAHPRGRRALLADHRPPLLPLDLLPRARRRPLRDRRRRPRLHRRRAARGARLEGHPAAAARAAPRADRGDPHAAARPAREPDGAALDRNDSALLLGWSRGLTRCQPRGSFLLLA